MYVIMNTFNPHASVAQKIADEMVFRRFQGEGVEFFTSDRLVVDYLGSHYFFLIELLLFNFQFFTFQTVSKVLDLVWNWNHFLILKSQNFVSDFEKMSSEDQKAEYVTRAMVETALVKYFLTLPQRCRGLKFSIEQL